MGNPRALKEDVVAAITKAGLVTEFQGLNREEAEMHLRSN